MSTRAFSFRVMTYNLLYGSHERYGDSLVFQPARARGLRDALPVDARRHTVPTRRPRPHATQGARIRIDYVLITDGLRVLSGKVVQSEAADRASDHYPVVVDLERPQSLSSCAKGAPRSAARYGA
jgi:endonuclease/exonuclease/phosphatase family metal-dependent hydrolase